MADDLPVGRYDLTLVQGATFNFPFQFLDSSGANVPLSGYVGTSQIRTGYGGSILFAFASGTNTGSGSISIDLPNALITMSATAAITSGLSWSGAAVWDIDLTSGAQVYKPLGGFAYIQSEVTR